MQQLDVVALPHNEPTDPAFQVNVKQAPSANGKQSDLKILLDMKGRFLSHKIVSDVASSEIEWPDSPVEELVETVLHYVTEQKPAGIDIKPFNEKMKTLKISQKTVSDGEKQAVVVIESSATSKKLEITLSISGDILNVALLN